MNARWGTLVVVAGLLFAGGGPVRAAGPPYDSTYGWKTCSTGDGICEGDVRAEVDTGRIVNSWTTSDGMSGNGDIALLGHVDLEDEAGAVVLTYHLHVNEVSISGFGSMELLLYASHEQCGGWGCLATTYESLGSDDAGDLVRSVRMVNQSGGNLPAGRVIAKAELYGGASGTSRVVADLVVTDVEMTTEPPVPEPPTPVGVQHVVMTKPYVGLPGAAVRFNVPPGTVAMTASIGDTVNDPVGGVVLDTGFCDRSPRVPVATGLQQVAVSVDTVVTARCGPTSFGTYGVVTVDFEVPQPVSVATPARLP